MLFYRGERTITGQPIALADDPKFIEMFKELWSKHDGSKEATRTLVTKVLGLADHWGKDLNTVPGVTDFVTESLDLMLHNTMREAIKKTF